MVALQAAIAAEAAVTRRTVSIICKLSHKQNFELHFKNFELHFKNFELHFTNLA
jgi:23S rRNA U2552 (ribose-2'-O)-methylase RlmE/FtsJ